MNKKTLVLFEQMGYTVDCDNDINKMTISDKSGNKLDSVLDEDSIVFYNDIHKIWIDGNGNTTIKSKSGYVITTRIVDNELDDNNHEYINIGIELKDYGCEVNIGLDIKRLSGLGHITIGLYEIIENDSVLVRSYKIKHERCGAGIYLNNSNKPAGYLAEFEYYKENYLKAITSYLDEAFNMNYNFALKEAYYIILPLLDESISEIIDSWFEHINDYINYYNDVKASLDKENESLNKIIEYLENLKKSRNRRYYCE